MHTPSPESPTPGSPSPNSPSPDVLLFNPFKKGSKRSEQEEQSEQAPPDDRSVIEALLGEGAAEDFTALLPHQEQEIPPKADLPGGELALSAEEVARVNAREQEQTPEHQARAWFLGLGKDEEWIEEHFNFKDGITCIASELNLSNCNIAELPSFFKEIKGIFSLDLDENQLTTPNNIPKEIGGDLYLSDNPNLASCAGLKGVRVGGDLRLSRNPSLASLVGLEGIYVGDLWISQNPKLASLTGLEGVHVEEDICLNNNPTLASLEGLPPKENIGGSLVFSKDQKHLIQEAREKGYNVRIN